jgi:hypothetical protein
VDREEKLALHTDQSLERQVSVVAIRDRFSELSEFERRPAEWREAVLHTLEQEFGNDLDRIWELLKGGTDKSLVEDMTRQELAIVLSDFLYINRRRHDKIEFQRQQSSLKDHGIPTHPELTYSENVKRAISAAETCVESLEKLIEHLQVLDIDHLRQFRALVDSLTDREVLDVELPPWFDKLIKTQYELAICRVALILATGGTTEKPGRGRPLSPYSLVAFEAASLWYRFTGKLVVTPKSESYRAEGKPKPEAPETSTQFIHLALCAVSPHNNLRETRTAIRKALEIRKLRDSATLPSKLLTDGALRMMERLGSREMRPNNQRDNS